MGKAPRVYTGAYQDDSDGEGFNLAGAELKACYEVGAPPPPAPVPGLGEVAHPALGGGHLLAWRGRGAAKRRGRRRPRRRDGASTATCSLSSSLRRSPGAAADGGGVAGTQGEVKGGLRHGRGTFRYPNPYFRYEGDYAHGAKHGHGVLSLSDGGRYEGSFVQDEICGQGRRTWPNGKVYEGEFADGEFHGHGELRLPSGEAYVGDFKENLRDWAGRLAYVGGDVYQGEFRLNRRHGQGELRTAAGEVRAGTWAEDAFVAGEMQLAGGVRYTGAVRDGLFEGEGEVHYPETGITFRGLFAAGEVANGPEKMEAAFEDDGDEKAPGLKAPAGGAIPPVAVACLRPVPPPPPPEEEEGEAGEDGADDGEGEEAAEDAEPKFETVEGESGRALSVTLHPGDFTETDGAIEVQEAVPFSTPPAEEEAAEGGEAPAAAPAGEDGAEDAKADVIATYTVKTERGRAAFDGMALGENVAPGPYVLLFKADGLPDLAVRMKVA